MLECLSVFPVTPQVSILDSISQVASIGISMQPCKLQLVAETFAIHVDIKKFH